MAWQPIPPPTSVPGATSVEELCGHPEQKYGVRAASGRLVRWRGGAGTARSGTPALARQRDSPSAMVSGVQFAERGQQRAAVRPVLAVHRRRAGHPVEHGFHRVLQEGPLLLDHDDLVEAAGELPDDGRLEREDHAELQQPDAGPFQPVLVEPDRGQRLAQREIAGAGGDDADPRGGRAGDRVDAAAARVLQGEGQPDLMERALQPGQGGPEQVRGRPVRVRGEAARQAGEIGRAPGRDRRRGRAVGHHRRDLQGGPQAAGPGQLHGMLPVLEDLGGVGRREGRHAEVGEGEFGRAGDGRRFRRRIVTGQRERATLGVGADEVRVPQRVGGPVQAGRLAVPDAGHARIAQIADLARELRAGHGGRGELLVQAGLGHDGVLGEQRGVARQLEVEAAQRGALIAGHVGRRGPPGALVGPRPVEQHAHQRLDAGQVDGPLLAAVAILEAELRTGTGRHWTHTDLHICQPGAGGHARRSLTSSPER